MSLYYTENTIGQYDITKSYGMHLFLVLSKIQE